jgi:hypothetical protein
LVTLPLPVDDLKEPKADLDAMGKLLNQLPDLADEPAVVSGAALRALRVLLAGLDRNRTFGA